MIKGRFRRLTEEEREEIRRTIEKLRGLHPPLLLAVAEDARSYSSRRGERFEFDNRRGKWLNVLRLMGSSDHFAGLVLYRLSTALRRRGIPLLPRIIYLIDTYVFRITIGEHVVVREGAYIPHGDVLVDGLVYLGRRCVILPFSTIGLIEGDAHGPWIEDDVEIGTGARVLGPIQVGRGARIGANAVVLHDVPPGATAVGVPARIVQRSSQDAGQ